MQRILEFQRITSPVKCPFPALPECSRHSGWASPHLPALCLCKRRGQTVRVGGLVRMGMEFCFTPDSTAFCLLCFSTK